MAQTFRSPLRLSKTRSPPFRQGFNGVTSITVFHNLTRRSFIGSSISIASLGLADALADRLFGAPAPESETPSPELEKLGAVAISEAKKAGATYADLRVGRYRNQF